jgi:hypothetical protein
LKSDPRIVSPQFSSQKSSAIAGRLFAATHNGFAAWLRFGNGGVIAENDPAEQEK